MLDARAPTFPNAPSHPPPPHPGPPMLGVLLDGNLTFIFEKAVPVPARVASGALCCHVLCSAPITRMEQAV